MKSILSSMLILMILLVGSSYGETLRVEQSIPTPDISLNGQLSSDLLYVTKEPGAPKLPFESYKILLPYGERIDEVSIMFGGYQEIAGKFQIPHNQQPRIVGDTPKIIPPNTSIYNSDRSYPIQNYKLVSMERYAGFDIAFINVYPYKYQPLSKNLGYYKNITIEISTSHDDRIQAAQERKICKSESVLKKLKNMTLNPELINTYPNTNTPLAIRSLVSPDSAHQFLVITGQEFTEMFDDYCQWKEEHGITAKVYSIEDIYAQYTDGIDNADNLRNFIIEAYESWASTENPLEYVLLAGDDEIIPIRGCWGYTMFYGTDYHVPCDIYFGSLDGDWNANGNQFFGEEDDEADLFPEVHIGRFTADEDWQFLNIINKIKTYVDFPTAHLDNSLMIGEQLSETGFGGNLLDEICDNPLYMPEYYGITKLYDRDGTFSTEAVVDHINSDASSIMYHVAHTYYDYLFGLNAYDMHDLQNTEYPLFGCGGCHALAFDSQTSGYMEAVGEHALFAENGMMGFIGHSRYGISTWTEYIKQMMAAIFTENIPEIGAALSYARQQLIPFISSSDAGRIYRWEAYSTIYAGDPQIKMYNGQGNMPNLEIVDYTVLEQGNGDEIISPGEQASVGIILFNGPDFGGATNVTATVIPVEGFYEVIDGYRDFGDLPPESMAENLTDPFEIQVCNDCSEGDIEVIIEVEANIDEVNHFRKQICVSLQVLQSGIKEIIISTTPLKTELYTNYPNPFNPTTTIKFDLAKKSVVNLAIFDITGKLVRTLISGEKLPGQYSVSWNGKDDFSNYVNSGMYLYQIKTPEKTFTKQCLLLK